MSYTEDPLEISLIEHPKGLKIESSRKGQMTGVEYNEIRGYTLQEDIFDNAYRITLHIYRNEEFVCSFNKKELSKVLTFIRSFRIREMKTERSEEEIRVGINSLKKYFQPPEPGSINIKETIVEGVFFGARIPFELTNEYITWKGRKLDLEDATGFSYGTDEFNRYNSNNSNSSYYIMIHERNGNPMHIQLSSMKNGDLELFYHKVVWKLYALLSVKEILRWLEEFAEGNDVKYDTFSLSRTGVHFTDQQGAQLIPWEDLRVLTESKYTFVSYYDRDVRLFLDARYDRRANMLQSFNRWLLKDKSRLKALIG